MVSLLVILGTFSTVFTDQGFWQISVSAKPGHSVWGFLTGGLIWFAVPIVGAFTFGMTYWSWTVSSGNHIVSEDQAKFGRFYFLTTLFNTTAENQKYDSTIH